MTHPSSECRGSHDSTSPCESLQATEYIHGYRSRSSPFRFISTKPSLSASAFTRRKYQVEYPGQSYGPFQARRTTKAEITSIHDRNSPGEEGIYSCGEPIPFKAVMIRRISVSHFYSSDTLFELRLFEKTNIDRQQLPAVYDSLNGS